MTQNPDAQPTIIFIGYKRLKFTWFYLQETGKLKSIFFTIVWFVDVSKTAIDAGVDFSIVKVDVNFWVAKGSTTSITSDNSLVDNFWRNFCDEVDCPFRVDLFLEAGDSKSDVSGIAGIKLLASMSHLISCQS